jgi:hypothetical protein
MAEASAVLSGAGPIANPMLLVFQTDRILHDLWGGQSVPAAAVRGGFSIHQ